MPKGRFGERGIRTLGTLTDTHDFQSCTLGRSVISPERTFSRETTEREGFEPSELQAAQRISSPPDSTALASLQQACPRGLEPPAFGSAIQRSIQLSYGHISDSRRGWDSNPRYRFCQYNSLAGSPIRPLSHLSSCTARVDEALLHSRLSKSTRRRFV